MFTGKQIKSLKRYKDIVIRLKGERGSVLEAINQNWGEGVETCTTIEDCETKSFETGVWVYSFANQQDTNWQFFVKSLRPTDEVMFVTRNNSNQYVKDLGLVTEELQAVIHRGRSILRNTIASHTVPADYCELFQKENVMKLAS